MFLVVVCPLGRLGAQEWGQGREVGVEWTSVVAYVVLVCGS